MTLKKDKISVVMSTYNTKTEYLQAAIDSILNQTYNNIEFIIVCDGNYDEYLYIKNNFVDDRLILILHDKNMGLPYSLNEAIRQSSGEYIARMDSDDISLKNRLNVQLKFMKKNPNIEICGMYTENFGDLKGINRLFYKKPEEISAELLFMPVLYHPTVMFRKTFFEKKIFYNIDYKCAQDFELWTNASVNNNIAIIPKVGLCYRISKTQSSKSKREIQIDFTKKILKKNALKLCDNKNDFKGILNVLEIFYGFSDLNKDNYLLIADQIKKIIRNDAYNSRAIKNVFYNRYAVLVLKNRLFFSIF